MSTPTLRRLDDRERYWGLTWAGWLAIVAGFAALYVAVRLSPFGTKPTITITLVVLTFVGMVLHGVSGQALSPGRQLLAIVRYRRSPKLLELPGRADRRGLVLDTAPGFRTDDGDVIEPEDETPGDDVEPDESSSLSVSRVSDRLRRIGRPRCELSPVGVDQDAVDEFGSDRGVLADEDDDRGYDADDDKFELLFADDEQLDDDFGDL
jgi:hypothetical protein